MGKVQFRTIRPKKGIAARLIVRRPVLLLSLAELSQTSRESHVCITYWAGMSSHARSADFEPIVEILGEIGRTRRYDELHDERHSKLRRQTNVTSQRSLP